MKSCLLPTHNIHNIVKELATADLVIQEIYYARQNLEKFLYRFT